MSAAVPLHWRINGGPARRLGGAPHCGRRSPAGRADARTRSRRSRRHGLGAHPLHIFPDARIACEVAVYIALRDVSSNSQLLGQAERRHAVDQPEVNGFGTAPLVLRYIISFGAEDLRGGGAMDVVAVFKGAQQTFVRRQMGHDAQLDLRVIGGNQFLAGCCDEGLADATAFGGADRDVLQIGVGRRQPPSRGYRLL